MSVKPTGNIYLVAAPSGAGKSSLVNALLAQEPSIMLSISCTTRPIRPGEENGKHYHFVSTEEYNRLRDSNNLLEHAEVHSNFYGTPAQPVRQALEQGLDVLLEIDWQGARQVREHFPNAIGIFILPPSIEELGQRLRKRGQDDDAVIARRLLAAGGEMAHVGEFQYAIINKDFDVALTQLTAIIQTSRLRTTEQAKRHADLFNQLGISASVAADLL
ncbi:guanylate kinase [Paenalcaligenes faecalis]|uniref:guanylate kinase n=1 Tax=Paenalcaligenes faecalis TaxID=2980099 RepID=UPI0022B9C008|nr:guanylate kinase [Paenalcaligenes faecalis]